MADWLIHEWPHSRDLGEKWVAFPMNVPADEPWPGMKMFSTKSEAEAYAAEHGEPSSLLE